MRTIRLLLCLLCLAFAGLAHAVEDGAREQLDTVKSALAEIDDELKLDNLSDYQLAQLRARAEPLSGQLQNVIAELSPRLDASRKRLAELKPKAQEAAQPDPAADELKAEQTKFDKLDADLRSARAALLQVDDYIGRISSRAARNLRQADFCALDQRAEPAAVARRGARTAAGHRLASASSLADAASLLAARATWLQLGGFFGLCLALLALAAPLRWIAHRVIAPAAEEEAPGRLRKALVALWTLAVLAALPLVGARHRRLRARRLRHLRSAHARRRDALLDGLRLIALAYACARALLAPKRSRLAAAAGGRRRGAAADPARA